MFASIALLMVAVLLKTVVTGMSVADFSETTAGASMLSGIFLFAFIMGLLVFVESEGIDGLVDESGKDPKYEANRKDKSNPMIKKKSNKLLYHGLTIDQFLEHWQTGVIRGLSRHHLDSGNGTKGTWLSDDFNYILDAGYGKEVIGESEVLADWSEIYKKLGIKGDGKIRQ